VDGRPNRRKKAADLKFPLRKPCARGLKKSLLHLSVVIKNKERNPNHLKQGLNGIKDTQPARTYGTNGHFYKAFLVADKVRIVPAFLAAKMSERLVSDNFFALRYQRLK